MFMLAPFTSGASLLLLLGTATVAAGVQAYGSYREAQVAGAAEISSVRPGTELVTPGTAEHARLNAEADLMAFGLAVLTLGAEAFAAWWAGAQARHKRGGCAPRNGYACPTARTRADTRGCDRWTRAGSTWHTQLADTRTSARVLPGPGRGDSRESMASAGVSSAAADCSTYNLRDSGHGPRRHRGHPAVRKLPAPVGVVPQRAAAVPGFLTAAGLRNKPRPAHPRP